MESCLLIAHITPCCTYLLPLFSHTFCPSMTPSTLTAALSLPRPLVIIAMLTLQRRYAEPRLSSCLRQQQQQRFPLHRSKAPLSIDLRFLLRLLPRQQAAF